MADLDAGLEPPERDSEEAREIENAIMQEVSHFWNTNFFTIANVHH
jgi:hypothetical protein